MSTKKATTATVCAGCEKRDATIKRQEQEAQAAHAFHANIYDDWLETSMERTRLAVQRDALQSRIDSFISLSADIRAACEDAGIEHADKMATLTAVKALADNAKANHNAACELANQNMRLLVRATRKTATDAQPVTANRPSVLPWIILALNLAVLGRLLTM